jgi:hypothetical protein
MYTTTSTSPTVDLFFSNGRHELDSSIPALLMVLCNLSSSAILTTTQLSANRSEPATEPRLHFNCKELYKDLTSLSMASINAARPPTARILDRLLKHFKLMSTAPRRQQQSTITPASSLMPRLQRRAHPSQLISAISGACDSSTTR